MIPIFEQVSGHGQGLGHDDFKKRFKEICEEHLREKRARIFAFVFYDMTHGTVREALYDLLTRKMGLGGTQAHIGDFTLEQCVEARAILMKYAKKKGLLA